MCEIPCEEGSKRGTAHHADGIQLLVKWDDSSLNSLRLMGRRPERQLLAEYRRQCPPWDRPFLRRTTGSPSDREIALLLQSVIPSRRGAVYMRLRPRCVEGRSGSVERGGFAWIYGLERAGLR